MGTPVMGSARISCKSRASLEVASTPGFAILGQNYYQKSEIEKLDSLFVLNYTAHHPGIQEPVKMIGAVRLRFDAVIFDLDGTLLNTLEDIAVSANTVLRDRRYPEYPVENYKNFVGDGLFKLMERLLPDSDATPELVKQCVLELRENYSRNWNVNTRPYDGIPEMLDHLVSRSFKLAVLSNKPDDFTKLCVGELLPLWEFTVVRGNRDGYPHKPDPVAAVEIAGRLGVSPSNVLFVGDSDIDIKTAKNAGMYPAGVTWGFRSRAELTASGALTLFDRPQDISRFLDSTDPG